jgi:pimeloyl-ACP methyl ester carboxylesterase
MLEMPPRQFAEVNGISLAYYEAGPLSDPTPLVLCHGWPEIAFSWRYQIPAFSAAGFRVIAPDMRGFGDSGRPEAVDAYDLVHITGDLVGLLDRLHIEKAIFVGHDWGGAAVWRMAQEHPTRVAGVVGLNTPYAARAPINPIEIFRRRLGEDFYIVAFQSPAQSPDRVFEAHLENTLSFFFRRPGPTADSPKGKPNLAFPRIIPGYDPALDRREKLLGDEEMAVYIEAFRESGFTPGINWYRNIERNWRRAAQLSERIDAPALMIMAELDVVLPPSAADGMEARIPDLEKRLIAGSGHWTMQEKPDEVNAAILEWRRRKFS